MVIQYGDMVIVKSPSPPVEYAKDGQGLLILLMYKLQTETDRPLDPDS